MHALIVIDAHVHVYDCYDMALFFRAARRNFQRAVRESNADQPAIGVLCLTEGACQDWFRTQRGKLESESSEPDGRLRREGFHVSPGREPNLLQIDCDDRTRMLVIAGRQIVTREGVEVLALGMVDPVTDGRPITDVIGAIHEVGALPILPWGAGKWMGARKRVIASIVASSHSPEIFIGDNANRPWFWPLPNVFRQNRIFNIPGSDPLPFATEAARPGSYGAYFAIDLDMDRPAAAVISALKQHADGLHVYGTPERIGRFFRHQMLMQVKKRRSPATEKVNP